MANSKIQLYQVPVASTSFVKEAFPIFGSEPSIRYVFELNGKRVESGLKFDKVAAWAHRAERSCSLWYLDGVYDTLVEVLDSDWARDIRDAIDEPWKSKWQTRHYMIYLDSVGCFEFIADSWSVLPIVTWEPNRN